MQYAIGDASLISGTSSVMLLQSSSARLHVSVLGVTSPTHAERMPFTQVRLPALQMPLPLVPLGPL